jgi:hypothetical protein
MHSAGLEVLCEFFEIIAFFFVTIDLYGRRRLRAFTKMAATRLENLHDRLWNTYEYFRECLSRTARMYDKRPILLFLCCPIGALLPVGILIGTGAAGLDISPWAGWTVVAVFVVSLIPPMLVMTVYFWVGFVGLLVLPVGGLTAATAWLIERYKFDGVLLFLGAFLFLAAKVLTILNTVT